MDPKQIQNILNAARHYDEASDAFIVLLDQYKEGNINVADADQIVESYLMARHVFENTVRTKGMLEFGSEALIPPPALPDAPA